MTFLNPAAFFLLGLAPAILLLHLRQKKRQHIVVPALFLWLEHARPATLDRGARHLRDPLSLALNLAILTLATLAAARPSFFTPDSPSPTVIVADRSARMRAIDSDGVRRANAAVARLREAVERHPAAAIIEMASAPSLLARHGASPQEIEHAIRKISSPTLASPNQAAALLLARDLLAAQSRGPGRIVWISDKAPTDTADTELEFLRIGKPSNNICISNFSISASENSSGELSGFVEVRSHFDRPWSGRVMVERDGSPHEVWEIELSPGGIWRGSFSARAADPNSTGRAGLFVARLEAGPGLPRNDALSEDDIARATAPIAQRRRILLARGNDPFFERALAADPLGEVSPLEQRDFARGDSLERLPKGVIAAFSDPAPLSLSEIVEARGFRAIVSGVSLFTGEGTGRQRSAPEQVRILQPDHPILRGVELTGVRFHSAAASSGSFDGGLSALEAGGWTVRRLADVGSSPFLVSAEHDARDSRVLFLVLAADWSDLPLRVAYPVLIANAIRWLHDADARDRAGDGDRYLVGDRLPAAPDEQVFNEQSKPVKNPPEEPGFYRITGGQNPARWVAVTLDSANVSDTRANDGPQYEGGDPDLKLGNGWRFAFWREWFWALLGAAALALLLLEWELYRRRVIG